MNDCKKTWNNLRDAVRRTIKNSQTKSGQSAKRIKKWKYEEEMCFLRPHMIEKDTISSFNILSDEESEINNDESGINDVEEGDNDVDINASLTHLKDSQYSKTNTQSPSTSTDERICRQKIGLGQKESNKNANVRKRKQPTESASAVLMVYIIKTKEENDETKTEQDGLDHFFFKYSFNSKKFHAI